MMGLVHFEYAPIPTKVLLETRLQAHQKNVLAAYTQDSE